MFADAVSYSIATIVVPPSQLTAISAGIWEIERILRLKLRDVVVSEHGGRWRRNVLHGDLADKVLEKARSEADASVDRLSNLRDPIEWLSLGELLEIVEGKAIGGFGLDAVFWRRFKQDVMPIRNRLSHMRFFRKGDLEAITMWLAQVRRMIGN